MNFDFFPADMEHHFFPPDFDGTGLCIGIVWSRFNEDIGKKLVKACLKELHALKVDTRSIMLVSVPGALELGVALTRMEEAFPEMHALIALGTVIRGETYHFEVVSNETAAAIARVSLGMGTPIINGVLTTDTEAQANARVDEKGSACARAAVEMGNLAGWLDKCASYNEEDDEFDEDDDIDDDDIDDDDDIIDDDIVDDNNRKKRR